MKLKTIKETGRWALLGGMLLALAACASTGSLFTKAPPTSDSSWADQAGGFSQR